MDPAVTVAVITYNHERYLRTAIESVLRQQTTFPVEILVGEDCSTDRTREVLEELVREHDGRFQVIRRPANVGLAANLQDCRTMARGRYLAVLEGDDEWIDPLKLQKCFAAMEEHRDWSMCFHRCQVIHEDHGRPPFLTPEENWNRPVTLSDMIRSNVVPTMSSAFYRQGLVTTTPACLARLRCGDWLLHILHAEKGPIGYIPEIMTRYRVHELGLWSGFATAGRWEEYFRVYYETEQLLGPSYCDEVRAARESFVQRVQDRLTSLEKIDRRYHALQLDHLFQVLKYFKDFFVAKKPTSP